jgi:hypothetical protein
VPLLSRIHMRTHRSRYSSAQALLRQAREHHLSARQQHKQELDALTAAVTDAQRLHSTLNYRRGDSLPAFAAAVAHLRGAVHSAEQKVLMRGLFG